MFYFLEVDLLILLKESERGQHKIIHSFSDWCLTIDTRNARVRSDSFIDQVASRVYQHGCHNGLEDRSLTQGVDQLDSGYYPLVVIGASSK